MKRKLSLIVAYDLNKVIGAEGKLPWYQEEDLRRVKTLTKGTTLVMGRSTFESIGRPLPDRQNFVITSVPENYRNLETDNLKFMTLEEFIELQKLYKEFEIFVFGGEAIYKALMPYVKYMYVTEIHTHIKGKDLKYFPEFNEENYQKYYDTEILESDLFNEYPYRFVRYTYKEWSGGL